jgi:hypothetical protein
MSNYIQNYGFTKTLINDNKNYHSNEIKWKGVYDGKIANIGININDNGNKWILMIEEFLQKLI